MALPENIKSWQDFKSFLTDKENKVKGDAFELLTKYYLKTEPKYSELKEVWLFNELSDELKQYLQIPPNDKGIDIVCQTNEGKYWAVQCKYLEDEEQSLTHDRIATFGSLTYAVSDKFSHGIVCTTTEDYVDMYNAGTKISFETSETWQNLTEEFFYNFRNNEYRPLKLYKPSNPRPHQQKAVQSARKHFIDENNSRGKLISPCGSGKSLEGFFIARELQAKTIIIAVPSLSLIKQTLRTWSTEFLANGQKFERLCVCSDQSVAKNDDSIVHVRDLGVPVSTNVDEIVEFLNRKSVLPKLILTTYQSGEVICQASQQANFVYDFGIFDEAHNMVGQKDKIFSKLLFDKNIKISKRMFMTATERLYKGSSDEIVGMDDEESFSKTFELLTFKEAIEQGILCDYKIVFLTVSKKEIEEMIESNAFVKPDKGKWTEEIEMNMLTSLVAIRKAINQYPIKHAVTFHGDIKRAEEFKDRQSIFEEYFPAYKKVDSYHVTGKFNTSKRNRIIQDFSKSEISSIITNARCLTEGVDVPNIDCVLFADPKKSTRDIVQATGRALRKHDGKEFGYVIVPVMVEEKDGELEVDNESFSKIIQVVRSLASQDERIVEEFADKKNGGNKKSGKIIEFDIDVQLAEKIDFNVFEENVGLRIFDRLNRLERWTDEEILEDAKKYNNRQEWNNNSGACNAARKRGKVFFDKCCEHMKLLVIKHTKQDLLENALKYNTITEWYQNDLGSYKCALKKGNKFFEKCIKHMERLVRLPYSEQELLESAAKYSTIATWQKNEPSVVQIARRKGDVFYKKCTEHMKRMVHYKYTDQDLIDIAKKYPSLKDLRKIEPHIVTAIKKRGSKFSEKLYKIAWNTECIRKSPNYWTKEKCKKDAILYNSRGEWQKKSKQAYSKAQRSGWLDECCIHMKPLRNYKK